MFHRRRANIKTIFSPRTPNLHHISIIACHDERSHPKSHHLPPLHRLLFWPTLLTTREMLLPASLWCFIYFVLMLCAYVFFFITRSSDSSRRNMNAKNPLGYVLFVYFKDFPPFSSNQKLKISSSNSFGCHFFLCCVFSPYQVFHARYQNNFFFSFLSAFNPIEHKKANKHKKKARRK